MPTKKTGPEFDDDELPEGFEPLAARQVDGWFKFEAGNKVQGLLLAKVRVDGQFGEKVFFKIEITAGETSAMADSKDVTLRKGSVVGLDRKGYLGAFDQIEEGRELWAKYYGTEKDLDPKWQPKKKGQSPAHVFKVAAVPV